MRHHSRILCANPRCRGVGPDGQPLPPNPVPDRAVICWDCGSRLRWILTRIAALVDDLAGSLAGGSRPSGGGTKISGTKTARMVFRPDVSEHLDQISHDLAVWVRHVVTTRGVTHPGPGGGVQARWLLRHVEWLRHQPDVECLIDTGMWALGRGRALVDLPADRERFKVGPCPPSETVCCLGVVWALIPTVETDGSLLVCDTCELVWDTRQWIRAARLIRVALEERAGLAQWHKLAAQAGVRPVAAVAGP